MITGFFGLCSVVPITSQWVSSHHRLLVCGLHVVSACWYCSHIVSWDLWAHLHSIKDVPSLSNVRSPRLSSCVQLSRFWDYGVKLRTLMVCVSLLRFQIKISLLCLIEIIFLINLISGWSVYWCNCSFKFLQYFCVIVDFFFYVC